MKNIRFVLYKATLQFLLRLPNVFYTILFSFVFPVYKALHTERAYGRTVRHLANAKAYIKTSISARDMFKGIFWNALDSYRGLARFKSVESRIVYENEEIIREAVKQSPVAAISIHQGAFELLHRSLCRYSEHVHLITDSVGNEAFREVLKELRSDPHLTEYHPEETGKLIRDLFKTKGILAMVFDQGKNTKGNSVELFGLKSTLYLRLPQKVNQMGASIVTFRTWTNTKRQIVIRFESVYPPKSDPEKLVADIAKETETWISEHPGQWSWNYHGNFKV
ncbi:KDO2-lipid IV(A) lauroyltransferase [Fibrobacter sp. UWT2]|nr:KDO2-lipid IV(A) lauroyltransferase [Fibrobacter sp. UWT2]